MKILIVDDDLDTAKYLASIVKQRNFVAEIVCNGCDALHSIKSIHYDLVLLDLDLPYINGRDVLKKVRKLSIGVPVIIISAASSIKEKILIFSLGADDYITKPFDSREFMARVDAVTRRAAGISSSVVKCGNLAMDITNQIAYVESNNVSLTKKEYLILELLITRKNSLVCKEVFLDHLYSNVCDEPNTKIIDVFICKLRKKLLKYAKDKTQVPSIKTIWGRGYMMHLESNGEISFDENDPFNLKFVEYKTDPDDDSDKSDESSTQYTAKIAKG